MIERARSDNTGISIVAAPASDDRIVASARPVAVFIGRTCAGALHEPVAIESYSAFERLFGGSPNGNGLAVAVRQFFEHGGQRAVVVRVANRARCGYIELATDHAPVSLISVNPGSAETLRASVDYDGIDTQDAFNLTVQRMDTQGNLIADQELYPQVSIDPAAVRFVGRVLEHSALVRLQVTATDQPLARPREMRADLTTSAIAYVPMTARGDDGMPLSDYDLIGSDRKATGLFALESLAQFDFLYAAREANGEGPGAAFVVAAEMYCQRRNAMLVVDPPASCTDVDSLAAWRAHTQHVGFSSLTYFPAVYRRGERAAPASAAGAIVGVLCRHDEREHVFASLADDTRQNSAALHRDWLPMCDVSADEAVQLLKLGVNPLVRGQQRRLLFPGVVTCANLGDRSSGSLTAQRLIKFVLRQIEFGTRWAVFADNDPTVWRAVERQVGDFMRSMAAAGAFEAHEGTPGWSVRCDAATNDDSLVANAAIRLLVGFRPRDIRTPLMYIISQRQDGTSVVRTALRGDER